MTSTPESGVVEQGYSVPDARENMLPRGGPGVYPELRSHSPESLVRAIDQEPSNVLMLVGDAEQILASLPSESIDFAMTSPPYWGHREYANGGIGQEPSVEGYVEALLRVFAELHRVMKQSGSFWLNLGDTYRSKALCGVPWRVALAMTDLQGWKLRNDVVWNKVKGSPDNSKDKLRNIHEYLFHFVKDPKRTFYDVDNVRASPRNTTQRNGKTISATGVSGNRYRRQIELSTALTPTEKAAASQALNSILEDMERGRISDFRMVIRGIHRVTHSDSTKLSGRAKELAERGFYFLKYHPKGAKLGDVWEIIPEDTHKRGKHYAPYPETLCELPIRATCPPDGIVLDPFAGTGTTLVVAHKLGRRAVGIDIADDYASQAQARMRQIL